MAKRLGLTAGEEGRPVNARQQSHFAGDRPNLVECPPIGAAVVPKDVFAEDLFAQAFEGLLRLLL